MKFYHPIDTTSIVLFAIAYLVMMTSNIYTIFKMEKGSNRFIWLGVAILFPFIGCIVYSVVLMIKSVLMVRNYKRSNRDEYFFN